MSAGPSRSRPLDESVNLVQIELKGDTPVFNDWNSTAVDHQQEKIYIYGGVRPGDEDNLPTNDFYCLDLKTSQWCNLTTSLKFRPRDYVFDPFCKDENKLERRELPALTEAACTIISVCGGTYFLLFGGHDTDNPTSDLIAVDLKLLIWWVVEIQGTPLRARMSASMVAVDNRLFIFGGRDDFAGDAPVICTYSIAEYNPRTRWTWRVSDAPLPPDLPPLGYLIQSVPVFNGKKILLTQGRTSDEPINISRESTIFFHTDNHTFQDARTTVGNFPKGIYWYKLAALAASAVPLESPFKRPKGPPRKYPLPYVPADGAAVPTFPDSVVMVAWVRHRLNSEDLVPEAWQYLLPPSERIRCLELRGEFWRLNLDLEDMVAVGNRMILLGSRSDAEMAVEKPRRWDVAVEILIECLKE
ncbi:hypothetical protein MSAN_00950200 [Mycena sanguinolenta]|uniref:Galactose oxidase n=1 Tax=Mycena sanguinolenta TaxID=230812 RepID=A0A8H6YTK0_9AGAR|nr:hypothetical protein MSAN_00950200 [Mycena sanguinolenta]